LLTKIFNIFLVPNILLVPLTRAVWPIPLSLPDSIFHRNDHKLWNFSLCNYFDSYKLTPWLLVRKRTTATERTPLVGEVSANICG
jgi:hypothetical protein